MVVHLYQSALLNQVSAAVHAAEISAATAEPPGGQIIRDHSARPTGMLLAVNCWPTTRA